MIRRDLGRQRILKLTEVLKNSIIYSLQNRAQALKYALTFARGMSEQIADRYIRMYVNELSIDCGDEGRQAVKKLFELAAEANLIDKEFQGEFVS